MPDASENQIQQNNINSNNKHINRITVNQITEKNQEIILGEPLSSRVTSTSSTSPNPVTDNKNTYEYNNRYYYNQLDNYAKAIYDAIANNIENLKYGNYKISVDYDFTTLLNKENGQDELNNSYNDAINAVILDIPNIFYIDFSNLSLTIEKTTTLFSTKYKLYIDNGKKETYYNATFSSQAQIEKAISQLEFVKEQICKLSNGSEYNKIRASHDWLIEHMEYEASGDNRGNVYGALMERKAVCEGYSRAYKYILDSLGVINILVTGNGTNSTGATEDHMWNYVKINGIWYAVDVTWDDPIIQGGGTISTTTKHKYFLIGSDEFFNTHEEKKTISISGKIFQLPQLSKYKY